MFQSHKFDQVILKAKAELGCSPALELIVSQGKMIDFWGRVARCGMTFEATQPFLRLFPLYVLTKAFRQLFSH